MQLELAHFEVVLHICILLNFIYAVSDEFSEKILPLISAPFKTSFKGYLREASVNLAQLENDATVDETLIFKANFLELARRVSYFNSGADKDSDLGSKFKCVYLLGGLYSFLLLLLAGFHLYLDTETVCCMIFYTNILVSLFFIVVLWLTFTKKPKVRSLVSLIFFFGLLIFDVLSYKASHFHHIHWLFQSAKNYECMTNESWMTIFSLIIVLSPFTLHIFRAATKLLRTYIGIRKNLRNFNAALVTIKKGKPVTVDDNLTRKDDIINRYNQLIADSFETKDDGK